LDSCFEVGVEGEEGRGEVVVIDGQIVSRYGTGYLPFVSFFMSI